MLHGTTVLQGAVSEFACVGTCGNCAKAAGVQRGLGGLVITFCHKESVLQPQVKTTSMLIDLNWLGLRKINFLIGKIGAHLKFLPVEDSITAFSRYLPGACLGLQRLKTLEPVSEQQY